MTYYPRRPRINYAVIDFSASANVAPSRSPLAVLWILLSLAVLGGAVVLGALYMIPLG